MVPKVMTDDQKAKRIRICYDCLVVDESEDISSQMVTGDESWVFEYDSTKKKGRIWSGLRQMSRASRKFE